LHSIRSGFELLLGEPWRSLNLRSPRESSTVPTELELLYFHSTDCAPSWQHREFTVVATEGLSCSDRQNPNAAELCVRIDGECSWETLECIGRALAELAVIPFREGHRFEALSVLEGVRFPGFGEMQHALIAHWNLTTPACLPGVSPPVFLLLVIPILGSELGWLSKFGAESLYFALAGRRISIYDPLRKDALEVI
jgi:suppressor of fused protein SUFU